MNSFSERFRPKDLISLALLVASLLFLFLTTRSSVNPSEEGMDVRKVESRLGTRFAMLEEYLDAALREEGDGLASLEGLPEDMVVYKYSEDTLRSWKHQFSLKNDDITRRFAYQMFANPLAQYESPLAYVTETPVLMNMGPKWYLVKRLDDADTAIIGGLEVVDENNVRSRNRVNPRLKVHSALNVRPLSESGGAAVSLGGTPVFKLSRESLTGDREVRAGFVWLSFLLLVLSALLFLHNNRNIPRMIAAMALIMVSALLMYVLGREIRVMGNIFSPALYADGNVLYSLGAVVIINITFLSLVMCCYFVRNELLRMIRRSSRPGRPLAVLSVAAALLIAAIWAYTILILRSIVLNSNIALEIYKIGELSWYSLLVYLAFIALLMAVPLIFQMLRPGVKHFLRLSYDAFSPVFRVCIAAAFALTVVAVTSLAGFTKEQNRQAVWANRLSIDRDIVTELNLRSVERPIERDNVIAAISGMNGSANIILNRITDNYMSRFVQDYDISVHLLGGADAQDEDVRYFRSRLEGKESIAPGSHFRYSNPGGAHAVYTGLFTYYSSYDGSVTNMIIELEPKANKQDKGYSAILGVSSPGKVMIPSMYDYAKYDEGRLSGFRGMFAYPTALNGSLYHIIYETTAPRYTREGYIHFVNRITAEEAIIISRPVIGVDRYLIGGVFLALITFLALTLLLLSRTRPPSVMFERNYFRSRVSSVLVISLVITLITMASVSVFFVYQRNEDNLATMKTEKVSNIRTLVENACKGAVSSEDLGGKEFKDALEKAADMTGTDISLYTVEGKVFESTDPEIFDKEILGCRLDEDAYRSIVRENKRYFMHDERIGGKKYTALYSPVFNSEGKMLCILSAPYTGESYDLRLEAVQHSVAIITVFLILLIIARFMIRTVVGRMFKPLELMGKKMAAADVESLEYIKYDNDDEISYLVQSYNRMVGDLTRSTRELAQAERDKAWSAMARQVAHEIKNPLTPMKLQIQRLIRLKQRNAPGWEEKFDEVSAVVLDHIDILSDTANEFSTFAKLYSEEASRIDLDALIKEELSMFDNKDDIEFSYLGLEDVVVMGPKPQLTRVLVNLVTNAVQAVEGRRQDEIERGETPTEGRILVQLRNSLQEGWYDIVIEDNGYGVAAENRSKLFTPNFTTKSSGTGLGLAICRSILDRCGATISYSTSFTLGGACFTIRYPKGDV